MIDTGDLERAMTSLPDLQLDQLIDDFGLLAAESYAADDLAIGSVLHAIFVLAEEQRSNRAELAELARLAIDGPDVGALVDPADISTMLDDARRELCSDPPDVV